MKKIGWIGLGSMGMPMAKNLLKAGFELFAYNRTAEKAEALSKEGAKALSSAKETAEQSDIIITMLANASAVQEVLEGEKGMLAGLNSNKIVIDMSTVSPEDSIVFSEKVRKAGAHFIDAPVSGSVKPAEDGTLLILAGGDKQDVEQVQYIFDVLGKRTIFFGENGKGSAAKLSINLLLGVAVQGISEAMLLAESAGLSKNDVIEMISESAVNTPIFQMKKESFLKEDFPAAFMLELMSKDLGLITDEAEKNHIGLPLAKAADKVYASAKENGKGKMDLAAVFLELKQGTHI
ncbi:NAD(P)-dependent oxidoreductase [Bacillus sp. MUM 13]|uniref:NAD(P)-dependent oxidoreductase n=1 Tax=Bacillus sp. MUM 13 TaxID=1678001 RepID=UPI0008F5923B|nr:NAD(P)-dependent oxidoreductase [Bacillus sp. MUM 13]OIK14774.1 3-hydroxyisobutyrate dehydrogenase [Bacillus sp. MUM 13]